MFSPTNLPVRPIEALRAMKYQDMNSAELDKLRSEDPEVFRAVLEAVDGKPAEAPTEVIEAPKPTPQGYWRNGHWFEIAPSNSFINGIQQ